ncbi:MAG TPA: lysylphosphatidylglycerol synthase transmembrane domain-containing protein [Acidimicrobiales bacterium]
MPTLIGTAIALVCLAFVVRTLVSQWSEVRREVADAHVAWLVAAVAAALAAMALIAVRWRQALALLGHERDRRRIAAWYFTGEMGKYVPGGVWPVVGRGELARRGGVPAGRAYPSVALSLAALYLAGLGVAAALVPFDLADQAESPAALALLLLLPAGLAALHPRLLGWARGLVVRFTGKGTDVPLPPWRSTVALVAGYVPAWLLVWAATWCTARALVPDPPILRIGIATTLSWAAGFAAVPVPAGAGVREAVFVASSGLSGGIGATVAVMSRLAFLLADVGGVVATAPWHRRAEGDAGPEPDAGPTPALGDAGPEPDTASRNGDGGPYRSAQ